MLRKKSIFQIRTLACLISISICNLLIVYCIIIELLCFWTYSSSYFYLKHMTFWRLDIVSTFRLNLLGLTQLTELVSVSRHLHQHEIGYRKKAQQNPSARVEANIKSIKMNSTHMRSNTRALSE
jgi:hypothetical protein